MSGSPQLCDRKVVQGNFIIGSSIVYLTCQGCYEVFVSRFEETDICKPLFCFNLDQFPLRLRKITQTQGLLIDDIMQKPNSIIMNVIVPS